MIWLIVVGSFSNDKYKIENISNLLDSVLNFSFNSIIILFAVFAPIPGTAVNKSTSRDAILFFYSVALIADSIWIAVLGPIPETPINNIKISFSNWSTNANNVWALSVTW